VECYTPHCEGGEELGRLTSIRLGDRRGSGGGDLSWGKVGDALGGLVGDIRVVWSGHGGRFSMRWLKEKNGGRERRKRNRFLGVLCGS
jgi:hypothetical protein